MRNTSGRANSALVLLCVVQGFERLAFAATLPLFVLYLHHRHDFGEPTALLFVGVFHGLSYVCGLPGGMFADRVLGSTKSLVAGAALLACGYGALAVDWAALLWPACLVMILGHGLLRPAMATMLGILTPDDDSRRERAFLWQYLVVNLAFVIGPLIADRSVRLHHWRGLFLWSSLATTMAALVGVMSLRFLPAHGASQRLRVTTETPSVKHDEPQRWHAVWLVCSLAVVFWLTALQSGGALALFAEHNTVRSIALGGLSIATGPAQFASLHGLLVLVLLPLLMVGMAWLRRREREPRAPVKMVWGYVCTAAAFVLLAAAGLNWGDTSRVSAGWLVGGYVLLSASELLLAPFGLSLVTKLAPPNRQGQAVGLWFAAAALGNAAAGGLGLWWGRMPHHRYFALLALLSLVAAVALFSRVSPLQRLLRAVDAKPKGGRS